MSDLLLIQEYWDEKDWGRITIRYEENKDKMILEIVKEIAQTGVSLTKLSPLLSSFRKGNDIYYDLQAKALLRVVSACIDLGFVYEVGKLKYPPQAE